MQLYHGSSPLHAWRLLLNRPGHEVGVDGGHGAFARYAGCILTNAYGSSDTLLVLLSAGLTALRISPQFPELGCWKMKIIMPCKDYVLLWLLGYDQCYPLLQW